MNRPAVEGFTRSREGRLEILVRDELRDVLLPLLQRTPTFAGYDVAPVSGGRGGTVRVRIDGGDYAIRAGRRGGLPAMLVRSLYFGREPRPFDELMVTETLRCRGVPVVEACAAAAYWVAPRSYRSWLVSRWLPQSETLWECLQRVRDASRRSAVIATTGRAVRVLHRAGAEHPDLNMNNILVVGADVEASVRLLDFDRAQLRSTPVDGVANLRRLRRSARKLDPLGEVVSDAELDRLERACLEGGDAL